LAIAAVVEERRALRLRNPNIHQYLAAAITSLILT
jgi:hypothetical protein